MKKTNTNEVFRLLRQSLQHADEPDLSDEAVDAFLSVSCPLADDGLERLRSQFVWKVLQVNHPTPIRRIEGKWPFGRWIASTREKIGLARGEVAFGIGKDAHFLEGLENGELLPWEVDPTEIALLVCLFRVHMDAVVELVRNTNTVNRARVVGPVAARSRSGRMTEQRGQSARLALDLYLAHNASAGDVDQEVNGWLQELRREIEKRHAGELLE